MRAHARVFVCVCVCVCLRVGGVMIVKGLVTLQSGSGDDCLDRLGFRFRV